MQVSNRIIKASAVVSCRIKRKAIVSLSVLSVLIAASEVRAGTLLFDTAAVPTGTSTLIIGDWNWPFHRFEVNSTTTLATVGGYFGNHTGATSIKVINHAIDRPLIAGNHTRREDDRIVGSNTIFLMSIER